VPLEETVSFAGERSANVIALDEALGALERLDARKCQAVELRYFGGPHIEEIAETLDISPVTVRRDLRMAESWLYHEMRTRMD
jgi:RNA polymerase sigma-70 factor, ECF subfamily